MVELYVIKSSVTNFMQKIRKNSLQHSNQRRILAINYIRKTLLAVFSC